MLLWQDPQSSHGIGTSAQSTQQSGRGGVSTQDEPKGFKIKPTLRNVLPQERSTVSSTADLVQLNQQMISCQKHHLLGKGIISLEASDPGSCVQLSNCVCYN